MQRVTPASVLVRARRIESLLFIPRSPPRRGLLPNIKRGPTGQHVHPYPEESH